MEKAQRRRTQPKSTKEVEEIKKIPTIVLLSKQRLKTGNMAEKTPNGTKTSRKLHKPMEPTLLGTKASSIKRGSTTNLEVPQTGQSKRRISGAFLNQGSKLAVAGIKKGK